MMGRRQKLDGTTADAVTGWRKVIKFRRGERAYAKKRLNRQERRSARRMTRVEECVVRGRKNLP